MAFAMFYTLSSAVQYIAGTHKSLPLYIVQRIFIKVTSQKPLFMKEKAPCLRRQGAKQLLFQWLVHSVSNWRED